MPDLSVVELLNFTDEAGREHTRVPRIATATDALVFSDSARTGALPVLVVQDFLQLIDDAVRSKDPVDTLTMTDEAEVDVCYGVSDMLVIVDSSSYSVFRGITPAGDTIEFVDGAGCYQEIP